MKITFQVLGLLISTMTCFCQESNLVETQEGVLHYEVMGEGKPILIINGGPGFSSEGFRNIAESIASLGYKSIIFDQRGTGKSSLDKIDSTTITIEKMALDMELIRKDIGVEKWILFGHSFGGMLANYYASLYPETVLAMIHSSSGGLDLHLIEAAQENLNARLTEQEIDSLQYWRTRLLNDNNEANRLEFNKILASAYVYNKEHIPTVSSRLMQGNLTLNRMVWNDLIATNFDCKQKLQSLDAPVLIIQGRQDVIPDTLAYIADSVFQNSTLILLDKCGHYGWLDQNKLYLATISQFLKGIEKSDVEEIITN